LPNVQGEDPAVAGFAGEALVPNSPVKGLLATDGVLSFAAPCVFAPKDPKSLDEVESFVVADALPRKLNPPGFAVLFVVLAPRELRPSDFAVLFVADIGVVVPKEPKPLNAVVFFVAADVLVPKTPDSLGFVVLFVVLIPKKPNPSDFTVLFVAGVGVLALKKPEPKAGALEVPELVFTPKRLVWGALLAGMLAATSVVVAASFVKSSRELRLRCDAPFSGCASMAESSEPPLFVPFASEIGADAENGSVKTKVVGAGDCGLEPLFELLLPNMFALLLPKMLVLPLPRVFALLPPKMFVLLPPKGFVPLLAKDGLEESVAATGCALKPALTVLPPKAVNGELEAAGGCGLKLVVAFALLPPKDENVKLEVVGGCGLKVVFVFALLLPKDENVKLEAVGGCGLKPVFASLEAAEGCRLKPVFEFVVVLPFVFVLLLLKDENVKLELGGCEKLVFVALPPKDGNEAFAKGLGCADG
jgi:hypothetical protein